MTCTFRITHRFAWARSKTDTVSREPTTRSPPHFDTDILQRLLGHINATLQTDVALELSDALLSTSSHGAAQSGRTVELSIALASVDRGQGVKDEGCADVTSFRSLEEVAEPTLDELAAFVAQEGRGGIRGKTAILHTSLRSSFAHYLESCLVAWGVDVTPMPTEREGIMDEVEPPTAHPQSEGSEPSTPVQSSTPLPSLSNSNFIIIDDDVDILRARLQQIRKYIEVTIKAATPSLRGWGGTASGRSRPGLGLHSRSKSSPVPGNHSSSSVNIPGMIEEGVVAVEGGGAGPSASPTGNDKSDLEADTDPGQVNLIHFTSLSNYKVVQDILRSTLSSATTGDFGQWTSLTGSPHPPAEHMPGIMVIPKPAGPRRLLTALHTAVRKPNLDPFFAPIASTPTSPRLRPIIKTPSLSTEGRRASGSKDARGSLQRHSSNNSNASGSSSRSRTSGPGVVPIDQLLGDDIDPSTQGPYTSVVTMPLTYYNFADHPYAPFLPSPLAAPSTVEYFPLAPITLPSTPVTGNSAGVLLHNPEGRPSGIFFQPQHQSKGGKRSWSNGPMEAHSDSPRSAASRAILSVDIAAASTPTLDRSRPNSASLAVPPTVGRSQSMNSPPMRPLPVASELRRTSSGGGGEDPGRPQMLRYQPRESMTSSKSPPLRYPATRSADVSRS